MIRDGVKAVELGERADFFTGHKSFMTTATLAAAYAEAGRFPEAIKTANRALELALKEGDTTAANSIRTQMEAYRSNQAWRDYPGPASRPKVYNNQKIVVVMPAYHAAKTLLRRTYDEVMAQGVVDLVIIVDDASQDDTVAIARTLEHVQVEVHPKIAAMAEIRRLVIGSHSLPEPISSS